MLLPEKPAWLGSDVVAWFRQFSQDSIKTSPDEELDVVDLSCVYMSTLLVKICDENVFVMSPCCGGCQILAGSRMQPENSQVIVGVPYVSVTGVK